MAEVIEFESAAFAVDRETRTLRGVLLPFGAVSRPARDRATGKVARFSFAAGTVALPDPGDVVLNYGHDTESLGAQVGVATELRAEDDGIHAAFRIAKTPEGDRILALADPEIRVLRAFSAEVEGEFEEKDGVRHAKTSTITGGAVVRKPAFTGAHITSVAASAASTGEEPVVGDETTKTTTTATATEQAPAFTQERGEALLSQVQGLTEKLAELEKIKIPVGPGSAQFQVREEPIYRFAGSEPAPSGFDFATDLLAAGKDGDQAALKRIQDFTAAALDRPDFITTSDTTQVNPPTYRPDMFLGQAPVPTSPLYDTFRKGSLSSVQPFFWSKLDRANTTLDVHPHVEGVEPNPDNIKTVVGVTVTPVPVSGKVHITREVADQGGNPNVSGMVWGEFERSYKISLEQRTAALIAAAMANIASLTAAIPAGANGAVAGLAVEKGLLGLQFLADGPRFTKAFGHVDLYTTLATYENADGEKRYPIVNPQNRDGVAGSKYSFLDIAGYRMEPAHSLGAASANASNSLVADPTAVHVWNSGLQRLDKLQEKVEGWDMGVFGYFAGVVYDLDGLRKISYDPTA
ncbi:hypothetical protein [Nocardioides sp. GXZ039]|uniref:hypothetical protein n=1 Tax=Nocardioides sp. GXZ039 TaxID=3136018 RepID=UPI0030F4673F